MTTKNPLHSAATAEHNTPREIVEAARLVLGGIDLDPMSNAVAQRTIRATVFYTEADNCFVQPWLGRTFLNPAGGLVREAWQRLMIEYGRGDVPAFIWIGYSLEQLQSLQVEAYDRRRKISETYPGPTPIEFPICIPRARLRFEDQDGVPQTQPTHANYICYGGPAIGRFVQEFSAFGAVSVPMPLTIPRRVRQTPAAAALHDLVDWP